MLRNTSTCTVQVVYMYVYVTEPSHNQHPRKKDTRKLFTSEVENRKPKREAEHIFFECVFSFYFLFELQKYLKSTTR